MSESWAEMIGKSGRSVRKVPDVKGGWLLIFKKMSGKFRIMAKMLVESL